MKKYLSVFIIALAIFSSHSNAHAATVPNSKFYFATTSPVVAPGSTFTLELRLNPQFNTSIGANNVVGVEAHVKYDLSKLKLNSISQSSGSFPTLFPGGKDMGTTSGTGISTLISGLGQDEFGNFLPPVSTDSRVAIYNFTSVSLPGTNTTSNISFNLVSPSISGVAEAGDNVLVSSPTTIVTIASADTVAPIIRLTGLRTDSLTITALSEKIFAPVLTVSLLASDNVGVSKVELFATTSTSSVPILLGTDTVSPYDIDFDTRLIANGTHMHLYAVASDAAGNSAQTAVEDVLIQNPPPAFSFTPPPPPNPGDGLTLVGSPIVSGVTNTLATITWVTNRTSNSQVYFGLTPIPTLRTTLNPNLVTVHRVYLSHLTPNRNYTYRVKSIDVAGRSYISGILRFRTNEFPTPFVTPVPTGAPLPSPTRVTPVNTYNH